VAALDHDSLGVATLAAILPTMDRPSHWILVLCSVFLIVAVVLR